jgi:energy-coupling factor transporter ATP-binding protein EcfA2
MPNKPTVYLSPAYQKDLFLHASAVNVSGKALLFLGHSSSGKSTISRLLSDQYPVIADDKVRVDQMSNGDWLVCNGDTNIQSGNGNIISEGSQKKYPLLAALRIFKSGTTEMVPLSPMETCRHLVDAVFEVDIQGKKKDLKTIKQWFTSAAEISNKIEGWSLTFKKDGSIINKIHENFE